MYRTATSPRTSVLPYWKEIQKMSREDRTNLAELIELSLEEDGTTEYQSEAFANQLDDAAMQAAADFAYTEGKAGRSIPHSRILDVVKEELGWE